MRELTSETRIKIAMEIEVTSVSVKSPHWGNNNCMFINGPSRLDPVNVVCQKGRKGGLSSRVRGWGRGWLVTWLSLQSLTWHDFQMRVCDCISETDFEVQRKCASVG